MKESKDNMDVTYECQTVLPLSSVHQFIFVFIFAGRTVRITTGVVGMYGAD